MLFILELPQYPNVDAFNFETMKKMLIEKLDSFNSAPFTIQRICELLADPRKQYSRIDKFMRAVEKTILVVSTQEHGGRNRSESENGDSLDSALNGDFASEVNVEIDMDSESSFSKDFSATTNRKDQNHEVSTTTTATTVLAIDVSSVTTVKAETNGSTEKATDAVLKSDDEELKSESATEVVSVTSSDSAKASSSNSDTEVDKDEDKESLDDNTKVIDEIRIEVTEEEPDSIDETPEIEVLPTEVEIPVSEAVTSGCDTTSELSDLENEGDDKIPEIIVEVSDPSVIAVVLPLAALESIVAEQRENGGKSTVMLEHFADSSALLNEDSSSASPDESEIDTKRMKFTDSSDVLQTEQVDSESSSENTASSSTTTSSSSTAESEEQPQVVTTTTIDTIIETKEDKKTQELMSTGEATITTTEDKDLEVETKPMNEEETTKCAIDTETVAIASSSGVSEMEAVSSVAPVESKMSFEEDITSETTEESVPLITINKMDTETDGDAMDVDDSEASSEPMDQ